jgi:hypothetical protein
VKQIHKEKLQQALPTYCKQIGILPNEMPQLITDRIQMAKIIEERKYDNYSSLKGNYGICYNKLRIICGLIHDSRHYKRLMKEERSQSQKQEQRQQKLENKVL